MIALVVDPSPLMARMLANLIRSAGITDVRTAQDAASARSALSGGAPGLLVTEWDLPGESGLDLAAALRADPGPAELPVILVTVRNSRPDVEKAIQAGIGAYLLKPVDAGLFTERVSALTAEEQPQSAAA